MADRTQGVGMTRPYEVKRTWTEPGFCRSTRKMLIECPFCQTEMTVSSHNMGKTGTGKRCPCGAKARDGKSTK